tara:strand:- start:95 stop:1669 length:1575 start_codon:yes stop_codon:yes gene_type:complete
MFSVKCFDESLTLKDGTKLISRIWHPKGNGSWPTLLMRQPYGRQIASTITYAHPIWWASKGYMVVVQDVRGQGDSEGIFEGFTQESDDTSETHEWVRSLKECNGKLGLYGFSYQGLTQLTGNNNSKPPDCLAPAMTGLNIKDHWSSDGGAFWWHNNISWALQMASLKMRRNKNEIGWQDIKLSLENKTYLQNGIDLIKKYDPSNFIIKWNNILNGEDNFEEIIPNQSWLKKPLLIYGGLYDPHLRGALDLYERSKNAGGEPELVIGNATHLNWWEEAQDTLLKFFNRYLKDSKVNNNENRNKQKIWNITLKKWENINFNIKNDIKFSLRSEGFANTEARDGSLILDSQGFGFASIVHDPWRPAPIDGGHLGQNPGMFNRKNIDERLDIAVFQTNIMETDLVFSGIPFLETSVVSDCETFDICLALSIVDNNEENIQQFSTGFLRVKSKKTDQEQKLFIDLQPTNLTILKSYKLRLSISAAAWPAIGVNSGSIDKGFGYPSATHKIITLNFNLNKTIMKIKPFFK